MCYFASSTNNFSEQERQAQTVEPLAGFWVTAMVSENGQMKSLRIFFSLLLTAAAWLAFLFQPAVFAQEKANREAKSAPSQQVTVRGKVFCLDESGHRLGLDHDCSKGTHLYEMVTTDKKVFKFSPDDVLTAMFKESKVRKLELQILGELHDKNLLEIASLLAIHDGKLYDIFYYCDICSITAFGPGDCPCCYNPLEFREKPALENQ